MKVEEVYHIFPVGVIKKKGEQSVFVEIDEKYGEALMGLDQFSHILLICWFHESDSQELRATLRVHPRGDRRNPLKGVFATRSPVRPNPIALFPSRIRGVHGNRIEIDPVDAFDGTPVLDMKPYIPEGDAIPEAMVPGWVKDLKRQEERKPT